MENAGSRSQTELDYLQLSCETMERVTTLTSPEQSRSLHLNRAQCRILADALSEAVQSARQAVRGLDPASVRLFAPAFRELCRVAGDCEKLVRDCCKENWLAVTILLADSRQDFVLRVSELKWCARAWRTIVEHGLQGGAWLREFCKSSQPSVADRGTDMGDATARLKIAFEEDLRSLLEKLAEMQGNAQGEREGVTGGRTVGRTGGGLFGKFGGGIRSRPGKTPPGVTPSRSPCDVDVDEEVRELAGYVLSRCEMIGGVRPDYNQARSKYQLPKFLLRTSGTGRAMLGRGAFGSVRKVSWFDENFAAKHFLRETVAYLDKEVVAMTKISGHPRLVRFLGVAVFGPESDSDTIVMELMTSDLHEFMKQWTEEDGGGSRRKSDGPFPLHVAVDIMLQVAEGVDGLHKVRLYHRDLKSSNVLVEPMDLQALREEGYVRVRLADFGSTEARSSGFRLADVGTRRWMAPEISGRRDASMSDETLVYPAKADAYSFGVVCFEILTGEMPYTDMSVREINKHVLRGGRPELPEALPSRLASLVKNCWDKEPTKRPSFTAICKELRYLKFLLTIGGEVEFRALDGPDEDAKVIAEIVKHLRWIDSRELRFIGHIGSGGYGSVDECVWQGRRVAAKNLLRCSTRERVEEEAALLVKVEHRNVVKLIGCAFNEEEEKGIIVTELMDQDLHHLIRKNMRVRSPNVPPFSLSVALEIMLKVATGMKHIRRCNVLHRDLKTTNVLVNVRPSSSSQKPVTEGGTQYDVKLADFGLSKYKLGDSMFTTKASEAQFWRAPETSEARKYSWPADVFSFGVVCYEILSGKKPFEGMQGHELLKLVRDGKRPEIPAHCPTTVIDLVQSCWATNPEERPDFAEICTKLEAWMNVNHSSPPAAVAGQ